MGFVLKFPVHFLASLSGLYEASSLKVVMSRKCSITANTFTRFNYPVYRQFSSAPSNDPKNEVSDLVKRSRIVLFMKGNPSEPRCGFSNAVCRILEMHGILEKARKGDDPNLFAAYDVLESEELRAAAKVFADWHTFPQLYFDGEFIGGCDIVLDMHRSGKLAEELMRLGIGSSLAKVSDKEET
ncbi:Glutaredoxin-related protein 5, mitochondrial [Schistosoma japonicum]|nr:Glutaredoxin-related protein 5, mitochondrial [Schistosoma japonicum]KAH8875509.1 Glutaredoxin-related protein 5, mitochondrial [Schistosoma japonicum]KAH8875510.1 Glutaredoxin-related protein 5, mitochondrial [Schistosoma japonicum]